jgi:hypothetical protein
MVNTPDGRVPVFLEWPAGESVPSGKERRAQAERMLEEKGVITTARVAGLVHQQEILMAGGIFVAPGADEETAYGDIELEEDEEAEKK